MPKYSIDAVRASLPESQSAKPSKAVSSETSSIAEAYTKEPDATARPSALIEWERLAAEAMNTGELHQPSGVVLTGMPLNTYVQIARMELARGEVHQSGRPFGCMSGALLGLSRLSRSTLMILAGS
jgi:hypothetical protein